MESYSEKQPKKTTPFEQTAQKRASVAPAHSLVDNRPVAAGQRSLQQGINSSPRVSQLSAIQQAISSTSEASTPVIQLQKYKWTTGGNVVKVSDNAFRNLRTNQKATEADYFRLNPQMIAEMAPIVSRTYETAADTQANAGVPAGGARQRSQSVHVPTRNRSGSIDIHHTHDNVVSGQPAIDRRVGHIDRNGVRTGRTPRAGSRAGAAPITRPAAGELAL